MQELNELRDQIHGLKTERLAILRQQCSREQVKAMLDSWLARSEEQGRMALQLAVDRAMAGQAFAPFYAHGNAAVIQSPGAAAFSLDLGPLFISVMGKAAVKKNLLVLVEQLPDGLELAAKAKRLEAIDADLLRLETEEEARIVEFELAGESILRRPDARPEVILA
jgi:hypothetical protein